MARNPVTHFEMGYKDAARMAKFYESVFGWVTKQMGPEMGNYVLAQTTETDENGMVLVPGNINGGFYDKTEPSAPQSPSFVIEVPDIQAAMKAVEAGGGEIIGVSGADGQNTKEPQDIPGVGKWMSFTDTEGNRVSLIEPPKQ